MIRLRGELMNITHEFMSVMVTKILPRQETESNLQAYFIWLAFCFVYNECDFRQDIHSLMSRRVTIISYFLPSFFTYLFYLYHS